jgi:hypothetical protein
MPQDVINRVNTLGRRSAAGGSLAFAWRDGTPILDDDAVDGADDDDSTYLPSEVDADDLSDGALSSDDDTLAGVDDADDTDNDNGDGVNDIDEYVQAAENEEAENEENEDEDDEDVGNVHEAEDDAPLGDEAPIISEDDTDNNEDDSGTGTPRQRRSGRRSCRKYRSGTGTTRQHRSGRHR